MRDSIAAAAGREFRIRITRTLVEPARAMRMAYLPFLMVYLAYGLSSVTAVALSFWTKDVLQFTDSQVALAAFWLGVPWTIKMLLGQFVDARPIFGSPRRAYIFIGAAGVITGNILLAGLAGEWGFVLGLGPPFAVYVMASVVFQMGLVIQDVTADAMTSEMNTGDEKDARSIQVLGRIAVMVGSIIAAVFAGYVGLVGKERSYETVFYIAMVVPLVSLLGALIWKQGAVEKAEWNKTILYGGLAFAFFVVAIQFVPFPKEIAFSRFGFPITIPFPGSAEVVWFVSCVAVLAFIYVLAKNLDKQTVLALFATAGVAFIFRAMPSAGPGVLWWEMDVLGFDQQFLGTLQTIGAVLGFLGLIFAARSLRDYSVAPVFAFLTIIGTILALPTIGMYYGLHLWTEANFGFGARTIAILDLAAGSPFGQLQMVPLLAFIAMVARFGNPATWFALAASLMNLALLTGSLVTTWLTRLYPVWQAHKVNGVAVAANYDNLGFLMILVTVVGFVLPLLVIFLFRKQLNYEVKTP